MRYGNPSIPDALAALRAAHVRRAPRAAALPAVLLGVTTGSVFDAVSAELRRWRWVPALRFVDHYHDEPGYIAALAQSVREHWRAQRAGRASCSSPFTGSRSATSLAGDPYYCQCLKTARLVAEALELPQERWAVSFQSRVGTRGVAEALHRGAAARVGAARASAAVDVICPGFSADCLETLEEIAHAQSRGLRARRRRVAAATSPRSMRAPITSNSSPTSSSEHLQGWPGSEQTTDRAHRRGERPPRARAGRRALKEVQKMIGRFLELSVQTDDILASVEFYERLGFRQLQVGETWSHPYAVLSDGRIPIGLHRYEFESPALTFVLPELATKLPHIERQGISFKFRKLGADEFNEAGLDRARRIRC